MGEFFISLKICIKGSKLLLNIALGSPWTQKKFPISIFSLSNGKIFALKVSMNENRDFALSKLKENLQFFIDTSYDIYFLKYWVLLQKWFLFNLN